MEAKIQREYGENICAITVALLEKTVYTGKVSNYCQALWAYMTNSEKTVAKIKPGNRTKKQNQEIELRDRTKI